MNAKWITGIAAAMGLGLAASPASAITSGFQNEYAPANWTFVTQGDGSVDTNGAPGSIKLTGSDTNAVANRRTDFTITALGDGMVSFDWVYLTLDEDGPERDPAGIILNLDFFQLTNDSGIDSQSGSTSFFVFAGQTIGFSILSIDDELGRSELTISNFSGPSRGDVVNDNAVPEPVTAGLGLLGLAALGAALARRR